MISCYLRAFSSWVFVQEFLNKSPVLISGGDSEVTLWGQSHLASIYSHGFTDRLHLRSCHHLNSFPCVHSYC